MKIIDEIKNSSRLKWLFVVFIFIIFSLLSSLFFQKEQMQKQMDIKIQFVEEKNQLRDELDDLIDEHDNLLEEYSGLGDQLQVQDSIIKRQISDIRGLLRKENDLKLAREKIDRLKEIAKRYIADIDSLLVLNQKLTKQKDSVIRVNKDINWKNYKLNKQNIELEKKVSEGSILEISDLNVTTFRYRKSGRLVETSSAKKTQIIQVCFLVLQNTIAKKEIKSYYLQIIDPKGNVISSNDSIKFGIDSTTFLFTKKDSLLYDNNEQNICLDWQRINILQEGIYKVHLYVDERLSAKTAFRLK
tara:strand:+ start:7646 stop:8548 length:903 start_codon:yes stop_codon:yes gene_type:complete